MSTADDEADVTLTAVRDFYEQHPYPPPVDDLDRYRETWAGAGRRVLESHLFWPNEPFREDRSVLVAGCGTSQAARYAIRWPDADVVGIDVSVNSIESTLSLKRKYQLDNLQVEQVGLERIHELGRQFDFIVSTGVLHHLPDPDAGLAALQSCLKPGGAMHLMVYAPYGRAGIYMIQDYCRRLGIGSTKPEIRELAASLAALPRDHPLVPILQNSPDFKNESALADALLHPQDRAYSVDEFFAFVEGAGLEFGRWIRQAPYLPDCGALTQIPHNARLGQLPPQQQFAAVELFRGNMLRHSAVVYHHGYASKAQTINFDGTDWLDYIPLRLNNTISVEERLPPTAAAVLINQGHTQTDIYLPVTLDQKKLVEAIDGSRRVRELIGQTRDVEAARILFRRLWCYDQVIFDTTGAETVPGTSGATN